MCVDPGWSPPRRRWATRRKRGRWDGGFRLGTQRRVFPLSMSDTMSHRPSAPRRRVSVNLPMSGSPFRPRSRPGCTRGRPRWRRRGPGERADRPARRSGSGWRRGPGPAGRRSTRRTRLPRTARPASRRPSLATPARSRGGRDPGRRAGRRWAGAPVPGPALLRTPCLALNPRQAAITAAVRLDRRSRPHSGVVGSIILFTSDTRFAGNPPWVACSRTNASFGAMYTQ